MKKTTIFAIFIIFLATAIMAITVLDSFEFDTSDADYTATVKIDNDYAAIAYQGPDDDGWLKIIQIQDNDTIIGTSDSFEFETGSNIENEILYLRDDIYVLSYVNTSEAVIMTVNMTGGSINGIMNHTHIANVSELDMTALDENITVIFVKSVDGDGYIYTYNYTDSGIIGQIDSWEFETGTADDPSVNTGCVNGLIALIYQGDTTGNITGIKILNNGTINKTIQKTADIGAAITSPDSTVDGPGYFIVSYTESASNDGKVNMYDCDCNLLDSYTFDPSTALYPASIYYQETEILVPYTSGSGRGLISVIDINQTDGSLTESINGFNLDSNTGIRIDSIYWTPQIILVTYRGKNDDGFAKLVKWDTTPTILQTFITPLSPDTNDDLLAYVRGFDSDGHDDLILFNCNWLEDGVDIGEFTTDNLTMSTTHYVSSLPANQTNPDSLYQIECRVSSAEHPIWSSFSNNTQPDSQDVIVRNIIPETSTEIFPLFNATTSTTLKCAATYYDEDLLYPGNVSFEFFRDNVHVPAYDSTITGVNNSQLVQSLTIPSNELSVNETWKCRVSAHDTYNYSSYDNSSSVTIGEGTTEDLIVSSAVIFPNNIPTIYDNLTCVAVHSEPNNLSANFTFRWFKDGVVQGGLTEIISEIDEGSLAISSGVSGLFYNEEWICEVEANTIANTSDRFNSSIITVQSTPLAIHQILLHPTNPEAFDEIWGLSNFEGDFDANISYWIYEEGIVIASGVQENSPYNIDIFDDDVIFDLNKDYIVGVRVCDPYNCTPKVNSSTLRVNNIPPSVSISISPSGTLYDLNTITATIPYTDSELHDGEVTIQWYKNGVEATGFGSIVNLTSGSSTTSSISQIYLSSGDSWRVRATAFDGWNYSSAQRTISIESQTVSGNGGAGGGSSSSIPVRVFFIGVSGDETVTIMSSIGITAARGTVDELQGKHIVSGTYTFIFDDFTITKSITKDTEISPPEIQLNQSTYTIPLWLIIFMATISGITIITLISRYISNR